MRTLSHCLNRKWKPAVLLLFVFVLFSYLLGVLKELNETHSFQKLTSVLDPPDQIAFNNFTNNNNPCAPQPTLRHWAAQTRRPSEGMITLDCLDNVGGVYTGVLDFPRGHHCSGAFDRGPIEPKRAGRGDIAMIFFFCRRVKYCGENEGHCCWVETMKTSLRRQHLVGTWWTFLNELRSKMATASDPWFSSVDKKHKLFKKKNIVPLYHIDSAHCLVIAKPV